MYNDNSYAHLSLALLHQNTRTSTVRKLARISRRNSSVRVRLKHNRVEGLQPFKLSVRAVALVLDDGVGDFGDFFGLLVHYAHDSLHGDDLVVEEACGLSCGGSVGGERVSGGDSQNILTCTCLNASLAF